MSKEQTKALPPQAASLGKRLLSISYDVLILFFVTVILTILIQQLIINLELVTLEKIKDDTGEIAIIPPDSILSFVLKSLWTLISFFYFAFYWTKRGQTPGMRVWKVKAISHNGQLMSRKSALYRYVFSLFGFGLIWILFDKKKLALQDRLSNTHLYLTK